MASTPCQSSADRCCVARTKKARLLQMHMPSHGGNERLRRSVELGPGGRGLGQHRHEGARKGCELPGALPVRRRDIEELACRMRCDFSQAVEKVLLLRMVVEIGIASKKLGQFQQKFAIRAKIEFKQIELALEKIQTARYLAMLLPQHVKGGRGLGHA